MIYLSQLCRGDHHYPKQQSPQLQIKTLALEVLSQSANVFSLSISHSLSVPSSPVLIPQMNISRPLGEVT